MAKSKVTLKNGTVFQTPVEIDAIDNNLTFVGFIMVPDEKGNRIIITPDSILLVEEIAGE